MATPQPLPPWRRPSPISVILFTVLALIVINLIVQRLTDVFSFWTYQEGQCTITQATLSQISASQHPTYLPTFNFLVDTGKGHLYQASGYDLLRASTSADEAQAVLQKYHLHQVYACWYNPVNPTEAVLVRDGAGWQLLIIGLMSLTLFFLLLLICLRLNMSRKWISLLMSAVLLCVLLGPFIFVQVRLHFAG